MLKKNNSFKCDRRYAEANFLQIRERRLYDGSYHAAAGMMLESGYDYKRAYRQRHADVVHLAGVTRDTGIGDTDEDHDNLKENWLRGNHPLAGPLRAFEIRRARGELKRKTEIA